MLFDCSSFSSVIVIRTRVAWDLMQAPDLRLRTQNVQQDVSTTWTNEVEVEVEQHDLGRGALQGPRQAQQQVVC